MRFLVLNVQTRSGYRFVTKLPRGSRCVAMIEYQGTVLVATEKAVFRLKNTTLIPLRFKLLASKC
jgi:hypothetical protein